MGTAQIIKVPAQYCVALNVCPKAWCERPFIRISACVIKPHTRKNNCCPSTTATENAKTPSTVVNIAALAKGDGPRLPVKKVIKKPTKKIKIQLRLVEIKQRNENHSAPRRSRFCVIVLPMRDGVPSEYPITRQNARHLPTRRRSLHTNSCCMACEPSVPSAGRAHI